MAERFRAREPELADMFMSSVVNVRQAFKAVLRKEHKWYFFASLANRVENRDEWNDLESKMRSYGYHPAKLFLARNLGKSRSLMAFLRYFRRGLLK